MVVTSGGIDKLEAYKRLKMPEVWFWQDGKLSIYHLRVADNAVSYEQISFGELLPSLDIAFLTHCIDIPNHVEAAKTFRQAL